MPLRDFLLLVFVCLTWAANNIVSKFVVAQLAVPPLFYAAVRFAVVVLAVFPWLRPMPRPRWRLIAVALLMGACNFALLFIGLKTATPSAAAVVVQLGVPITVLLSRVMLGERLGHRRAVGAALTFGGAMAVMWDPHGVRLATGLLYVVAATFLGALGAVMMKQMEGVRPLQFQAWVGFASFWPMAALSAGLEPDAVPAALAAGWPFAAAVLFSGLVVSVGAHTLYYSLILRYAANLLSPLTLMTPLATIGLGVLLFHDPFGPRMALGATVALTGVLVVALRPGQSLPALRAWLSRDR